MIVVIIIMTIIAIASVIVNETDIDINTKEIKLEKMKKHNQFCSNCKYHSTNGSNYHGIYRDVCELTRENYIDPVTGKVTNTGVRYCVDNVGSLFTCKWIEC